MLIIEGSDLVGKSTLCQNLVKRLADSGHTYSHLSRLPDAFHRYWSYVDRAARFVVQDRFHMSEIVYAEARGDGTSLSPEKYRLVDGFLRGLGAYTIVISCSDDLLVERYKTRAQEEMYKLELVLNVNSFFRHIGRKCGWKNYNAIDVDFACVCTPSNPFVSDNEVEQILKEYRNRQDMINLVFKRLQQRSLFS